MLTPHYILQTELTIEDSAQKSFLSDLFSDLEPVGKNVTKENTIEDDKKPDFCEYSNICDEFLVSYYQLTVYLFSKFFKLCFQENYQKMENEHNEMTSKYQILGENKSELKEQDDSEKECEEQNGEFLEKLENQNKVNSKLLKEARRKREKRRVSEHISIYKNFPDTK